MAEDGRPGISIEELARAPGPAGSSADGSERPGPERVPLAVPPLTVSLAVVLVDGRTGGPPSGTPTVSIDGVDTAPRRKSENVFLFLDAALPTPPTPAVVTVEGGEEYRDETREVVVTDQDDLTVPAAVAVYPRSNPTATVRLFSGETTVVRGFVRDTAGTRLADATVTTTGLDFGQTETTDANGRFVLAFAEPPDDGSVTVELTLPDVDEPLSADLAVSAGAVSRQTLVVTLPDGPVAVRDGFD